ncbi:hypothetical protein BD311DRAFT_769693 [Dichomitus squalens]|uniref:Uncharacterized protein n=1 Tax=Dichomitus squalens TaxID=114155 RepID=A0A4Q9M7C7_9APHY|nr:hypothetical protein BD311DRAFT_769693 [Dichomitus squalens]
MWRRSKPLPVVSPSRQHRFCTRFLCAYAATSGCTLVRAVVPSGGSVMSGHHLDFILIGQVPRTSRDGDHRGMHCEAERIVEQHAKPAGWGRSALLVWSDNSA